MNEEQNLRYVADELALTCRRMGLGTAQSLGALEYAKYLVANLVGELKPTTFIEPPGTRHGGVYTGGQHGST